MTRLLSARARMCSAVLGATWSGLATLLTPALRLNLYCRMRRGKESSTSLPQRRGIAACSRPSGRLIWLHAASVGETVAVLPVIGQILLLDPSRHVLITTGTLTAAEIVHTRLPALTGYERVSHQFAPLDVPRWTARFLDFWQPDIVVLVESELWPNLIAACQKRRIVLALVNGRMSDRSLAGWRKARCLLRHMLSAFSWIMARSVEDASRLDHGGAGQIDLIADLKEAADPLPCDPMALTRINHAIGNRPVWIAASTHEGEETTILAAGDLIRQAIPDALTIIIPRHPPRGPEIAALNHTQTPRRARGQFPTGQDKVWICDTVGETGLLFALGAPVLLGNSLPGCEGGGHNPLEPARAGCCVASGPKIDNFRQAYAGLGTDVRYVTTEQDIAEWVLSCLHHETGPPSLHTHHDPVLARDVAQAVLALGKKR